MKNDSFVYIIECGGRFKIGISKDVKRRKSQLNDRPFPCNILYISKKTKYAYEIEQHIHYGLAEHRIKGEWYNLSLQTVEFLKEEINEIMRCYENGIYDSGCLYYMRKEHPERFVNGKKRGKYGNGIKD